MQGKIIEYVEQGRFFCALVLQEQNKRLRIMNQNGREMNMPMARVLHESRDRHPLTLTREETMRLLQETADRRSALSRNIGLEEIWQLAVEEENSAFNPLFLTELCFGGEAGDDQTAAFLRAVFADRFFFKFRDNAIQVHSAEVVEQLRERAEKERIHEEMMEIGGRVIQAIMAGERPPEWQERDRCLEIIKEFYLYGSEAREADLARDLLKKGGLSRPHDPYFLLVKAGVWQPDENIPLLRQEVPVVFADDVLSRANLLAEPDDASLLDGKRRDFRHLPLLTIDGEFTRDFDDALHVERKEDGYLVGIHISDVSEFVRPGDVLCESARARGTSLYFPDQQIPMLPKSLSEGACSLIEGRSRPALSFLVHLSGAGDVLDFKLVRSVVRVKRRITYRQAEDLLAEGNDEELRLLNGLGNSLQKKRLDNGALIIPIPDVVINIGIDGRVRVRLEDVDSQARTLVAEFMVLANMLAAQYLADRQIPGLYRSQEAPRQRLGSGIQKDLFVNFRQRRHLARGLLSIDPKPHSGVGTSQYTTVTSPIRRMLDLVMQQQLTHVLEGKGPLYTLGDCRDLCASILAAQARANQVRQLRNRYWLFKYLATEVGVGNRMDALVLEIQPRRIQVLLTDILLEGDLPLHQGPRVTPGDKVSVMLAKVNALDNSFQLEW